MFCNFTPDAQGISERYLKSDLTDSAQTFSIFPKQPITWSFPIQFQPKTFSMNFKQFFHFWSFLVERRARTKNKTKKKKKSNYKLSKMISLLTLHSREVGKRANLNSNGVSFWISESGENSVAWSFTKRPQQELKCFQIKKPILKTVKLVSCKRTINQNSQTWPSRDEPAMKIKTKRLEKDVNF